MVFAASTLALGACASRQPAPPVTAKTVGPAFTEYAIKTADTSRDGLISKSEWLAAGGSEKSFAAIDTNGDRLISAVELKTASSTDRFVEFAQKTTDLGGNTELTPKVFYSPAGARLFTYQF